MTLRDEAVKLLSDLVAIPSMNPGDGGTAEPPFGEAALIRYLDQLLSGWGAETTIQEVLPGRPNLIAKFEGRNTGRSLLFEAHSDTVSSGNPDAHTPALRDGRLYGRGACDTKGPMVAMLLGIKQVLNEEGTPPVTVYFVSTCDEENGGLGAHTLMESGFRADAAVIGEPTGLSIIHAHKGALRIQLTTRGKAAHSSAPERGENAIYKMTPVLQALEKEAARLQTVSPHPLLGPPTLSVGIVRGGNQVNTVPDGCTVEIDRRLVPGEIPDEIMATLRQAVGPGVEMEQTQYYPPFDETPQGTPVTALQAACEKIRGCSVLSTAPYATNAGFFKQTGIPCAVFGPGDIAQAHTQDEFIEMDQLLEAISVFAEIIKKGKVPARASASPLLEEDN